MNLVGVLAVVCLLCCCERAKGADSDDDGDIYSCEIFQPANFNISIDMDIKFQVKSQYIRGSGKWVKVKWYNVNCPSDGDWIGVYQLALYSTYPIDPVNYSPIKYQFANVSSSHTTYGRGYTSLRLLNIRSPLVMGLFRGGLKTPTLIAYSNTVYFKISNQPTQVHLSVGGGENELMVTWISSRFFRPVIYWGPESGYYTHVNASVSNSYNASDMCNSPATDVGYTSPGIIHRAILSSLEPGQTYYYMVGDNCTWSQEYTFTAPPSSNQTFVLVAYGESGSGEMDGSHHINEHRSSLNVTTSIYNQLGSVDLLLHLGGLSFARGYSSVWDSFFDLIEPIASNIPYMVAAGAPETGRNITNSTCNNSTECGGECGVPFMNRFNMPWASEGSPWYDFDFGGAHFVVISTEHDLKSGSTQYEFIINSLQSVNYTQTPWIIVAGHRPMYTVSSQDLKEQNITDTLQANLEPLFRIYQVDLALWSYHHSYQRTCPVYRGNCVEGGTVHLVVGTGGAKLEQNSTETPCWIEYMNNKNHGYVRLSISPDTLTIAFVSTERNATLDSTELQKSDYSSDFYDNLFIQPDDDEDAIDSVYHDII